MDYCYYNGSLSPLASASVPLTDRAVFFGDGVYECMIGKNGRIHLKNEHIERLKRNAKILSLNFDFTENELKKLLETLILLSGYNQYMIYLQLTRYGEKRSHSLESFNRSNILITICEHHFDDRENSVKLITYPDERYKMCNVKTLNLLPSVLAAQYAQRSGCDEAVFIRDGIVTECSRSNIFVLRRKMLITHPNGRYILPGITRERLIQKAAQIGVEVVERCFGYDDLIDADEVIITSSTKLARRACTVDGKAVKMSDDALADKLCRSLKEDFDEICS